MSRAVLGQNGLKFLYFAISGPWGPVGQNIKCKKVADKQTTFSSVLIPGLDRVLPSVPPSVPVVSTDWPWDRAKERPRLDLNLCLYRLSEGPDRHGGGAGGRWG